MGSSRNSPSKAERRLDRKQRREAANRQDHRDKEKIRDKEIKEEKKGLTKQPKPWKRRDRDGSIILWNAIKISKTSGYIMGGMLALVVLFAISPIFEDPNYVEPERYTFAECEAIDFEDLYCIYDFKWTREYADGGTISEYAEFDPFVDLPDLGNKYTPEEQDFLPPIKGTGSGGGSWAIGDFILLPFAEARGPDEPSCYTCDNTAEAQKGDSSEGNLWARTEVIISEDAQKELDDLTPEISNKSVKEIKVEIENLENDINEMERDIQQWVFEGPKLKAERFTAENTLDDAQEKFDTAQKDYRDSTDMRVQSTADIRLQEAALKQFKIAARELESAKKQHDFATRYYNESAEEHRDKKNQILKLNDDLLVLLDDLNAARLASNLSNRDYQFVTLTLSDTCLTMIENGFKTNCPTYRDLYHTFDTSIPIISGQMEDLGYDLKRSEPQYDNHWKYYEQVKEWKVIIVDPDNEIVNRAANIVIQPNTFRYVENIHSYNKNPSINTEDMERYVWSNMKVTSCRDAIVSPDLKSIAIVIEHMMSKCTTELDIIETIQVMPTPYVKEDSPAWNFFTWLNNAMNDCKEKC